MKTKNILLVALIVLLAGMVSCKKDHDIPTGKTFNEGSGGGGSTVSYTVSVYAEPSNSGTVSGGGNYQKGQTCIVTASANEGYVFTDWTEDGIQVSTSVTYSFTVTADRYLVANFTGSSGNYTITAVASPIESGIINGSGNYYQGQTCTLTAIANEGYTFTHWTENDTPVSVDASYSFTVSSNRTLVANFIFSDYSNIILNELNGNDKFIEIYNSSSRTISLDGAYIEKDGVQSWLADNAVRIEAGGYLVLWSEDVAPDHPEVPEARIFHSGLSAKKNVRIQLFTPAGVSIDDFNLVNIELNGEAYGYAINQAPASYSRNADGDWYYAEATPGAVNVDGENIVLGLEGGDTPEPPTPEEPDYTNILLNELNGDSKFIEIYNMGDMDLPMEGMYIMKDEYVAGAIWTADATIVAPAHGYLVLYSVDVQADHPELNENQFFNSGISSKKTIRFTLFMPDGTVRDEFTRGTTGEWGQTVSSVAPLSYARTPDGGYWKLADPTPGAANPSSGGDIPQE
jgi:hypothetical protein